jgi:YcxB-like protein
MTESASIVVDVRLKMNDIYRATVALTAARLKVVLAIMALLYLPGIPALIYLKMHPEHMDPGLANLNPLPVILVPCFFLSLVFVFPYFSARKAAASTNVQKGTRYEFSPDQIRVESSTASSRLSWEAYKRVTETKSAFLLFLQNNAAHVIPKHAFVSKEQIAAFREMLRANLPSVGKVQS